MLESPEHGGRERCPSWMHPLFAVGGQAEVSQLS